MSAWETWWYYVIVVALCTYFGLAVVIAIGGFFDVKKMFRRLSEAHAQQDKEGHTGGDGATARPTGG